MSRIVLLVGKASGGIGVHVRDLALGLRDLGHEVEVATHPVTARTFDLSQAQLLWPDPSRPDPRRLARLRRLLRSADVVHAHGHQAGMLASALLGSRRKHVTRLVLSLHNELPTVRAPIGSLVRAAEARALRRADLVTGASSDLVRAAAQAGAADARLAPVPSPLVTELLAADDNARRAARERVATAYGLDPGKALVVTISRIAPQKDLPTLVAAAARLRTEVSWLVAGGGVVDLLATLRASVSAAALPVHFLGPVAQPQDLLLAADAFVLTSTWEARALVVQEAMAAGVPVVSPRVGGLSDLLGTGGGILVAPGDPGAIATALERILADPAYGRELGAQGRAVAAIWDTPGDATRGWDLAYDRLIRGIA